MKVKVKKSELYECVKNAVVRAINEAQKGPINEWYDDDDDDDAVARFLRNPKNQLKLDKADEKRAGKVFRKQRDKENISSQKDDDAAEAAEKKEMSKED